MDWQSFLLSVIPAVISGIVSYLLSAKTSRTEIEKIKELHKTEMEKLEVSQKHEIQKLELEFEKKMESDQNQASVNMMSGLIQSIFENPQKFKELDQMFSNKND